MGTFFFGSGALCSKIMILKPELIFLLALHTQAATSISPYFSANSLPPSSSALLGLANSSSETMALYWNLLDNN
jgi:hypothetical protein